MRGIHASIAGVIAGALALALTACGPSNHGNNGCDNRCTALGWQVCHDDGTFAEPVQCAANQTCDPALGCVVCVPGTTFCSGASGNEIWQCNADGTGGSMVDACTGDLVCSNGGCKTPCERALDEPSNVGCDFWAADLDNEAFNIFGIGGNDAAAQQYSVVVGNDNDYEVSISVTKNTARVGAPVAEATVITTSVPAHATKQLDLPQREVDGTMTQNGPYTMGQGTGTFVSPHAYHIVSTGPVVAYQFNPIIQQFSNDASLLIPIQALGKHYYVLGWPTANPCGPPVGDPLHQDSIPDHTAVTIVGVTDGTSVTITPTHPIVASSGDSGFAVPHLDRGQPYTFTVNRYDVVNLESDQPTVPIQECFNHLDQDGDLTGTLVTSDHPVVVFTSAERGIGFGGAMPPDPPGWDGKLCCTDHLEEQLFPTTALGQAFVVSRSPVRSTDPSWKEPDIYRVVGTVDGTAITTNLAAPFDHFTVDAGKQFTFYADHGFVMNADRAILFGQVLVSQQYIPQGGIGDPSMMMIPAAEQHRQSYVFLVPTTFQQNYMVLAKPAGASIVVDGLPVASLANCKTAPIGVLANTTYDQLTCPVTEGGHTVSGDVPFMLMVYGYYNVGSYGYPGGSDVKLINPID